jgi:hypothetical protein
LNTLQVVIQKKNLRSEVGTDQQELEELQVGGAILNYFSPTIR